MTIPGLLARGRAAHERLMLDTIIIQRLVRGGFDQSNATYPETATTVYSGKADVKLTDNAPHLVDGGQQTGAAIRDYDVMIPFSATATPKIEDRVTVTAAADPRLVGRVLFVTAVGPSSRRTAVHIQAVNQEQP